MPTRCDQPSSTLVFRLASPRLVSSRFVSSRLASPPAFYRHDQPRLRRGDNQPPEYDTAHALGLKRASFNLRVGRTTLQKCSTQTGFVLSSRTARNRDHTLKLVSQARLFLSPRLINESPIAFTHTCLLYRSSSLPRDRQLTVAAYSGVSIIRGNVVTMDNSERLMGVQESRNRAMKNTLID